MKKIATLVLLVGFTLAGNAFAEVQMMESSGKDLATALENIKVKCYQTMNRKVQNPHNEYLESSVDVVTMTTTDKSVSLYGICEGHRIDDTF